MNKTIKTKLKLKKNVVDELQYVQHGDQAPNPYVENAPKLKQGNTNPSNNEAVSGGNYIPLKQDQLSGENIDGELHEYEEVGSYPADPITCKTNMESPNGKVEEVGYRRLFKRDGVIYDLTSNEPLR